MFLKDVAPSSTLKSVVVVVITVCWSIVNFHVR